MPHNLAITLNLDAVLQKHAQKIVNIFFKNYYRVWLGFLPASCIRIFHKEYYIYHFLWHFSGLEDIGNIYVVFIVLLLIFKEIFLFILLKWKLFSNFKTQKCTCLLKKFFKKTLILPIVFNLFALLYL